ncbi:hypothetical protein [Natrinema sp. SYSU A 869]|uniref:hypothetical protein n=1 Tax=Natrinema sp. SYSU A 869 TaxID=2871694 RepID=UPI001CA3B725|nr:hypothetical protein [Natrinema sp. SYSU A 869]
MDEYIRDAATDPPVGTPVRWTPSAGRWEHTTLRRATVHGVRPFTDGTFRGSHDCFETDCSSVTNPRKRLSATHG